MFCGQSFVNRAVQYVRRTQCDRERVERQLDRHVARSAQRPGHTYMTISDVMQARAGLNEGKAAGGGSRVVAEIVRRLPMSLVHHLAEKFIKIFEGDDQKNTLRGR